MGLLQNGFRDKCGVFRTYGAGFSNGAYPQQLPANYALTGMRRNLTAGEGITDDKIGLPLGYLAGGSYQLPQKPGMLSARSYEIVIDGAAAGTSGLPGSGVCEIAISEASGTMLPLDDTSPARTASASFGVTAEATGELKMSGTGATTIGITMSDAELVGILDAVGEALVSISTGTPVLGAEASGEGSANVTLTASASMLPVDDTPPERSASATFAISGTLVPYAVGNMVGAALPYTELSPQSLASAVWNYEQ